MQCTVCWIDRNIRLYSYVDNCYSTAFYYTDVHNFREIPIVRIGWNIYALFSLKLYCALVYFKDTHTLTHYFLMIQKDIDVKMVWTLNTHTPFVLKRVYVVPFGTKSVSRWVKWVCCCCCCCLPAFPSAISQPSDSYCRFHNLVNNACAIGKHENVSWRFCILCVCVVAFSFILSYFSHHIGNQMRTMITPSQVECN